MGEHLLSTKVYQHLSTNQQSPFGLFESLLHPPPPPPALHGFEGGRSGMVGWSLPVWPSAWGEASKAWTIQCLSEPHLSRGAHPGICDVFVAAASKQPIWGSLMEIRGRALMTAIGGPFLAKSKIKRKNTQKIPRRRKPQLSSPTGWNQKNDLKYIPIMANG